MKRAPSMPGLPTLGVKSDDDENVPEDRVINRTTGLSQDDEGLELARGSISFGKDDCRFVLSSIIAIAMSLTHKPLEMYLLGAFRTLYHQRKP